MDKLRNIAVLLTSYKRPGELIKQLYTFKNQTYKGPYVVSVAVKEVDERFITYLINQHFKDDVLDGKFIISCYENKNQYLNLLDCVKQLPLKYADYDLFCKVDDDDYYDNTYLERVNQFHNATAADNSFFSSGRDNIIMDKGVESPISLLSEDVILCGSSLVFDNYVLDKIRYYVMNKDKHIEYIKDNLPYLADKIGFTEDALIKRLMHEEVCLNRSDWLKEHYNNERHVIINRTLNSLTHIGTISKQFFDTNNIC